MDAAKFLKIGKRICEYYKDCNDCPFIDSGTCAALPTSGILLDEIDTAIDAIKNWDEEHQVKTYYSVFKEKFPNSVDRPWMENVCIRTLYGDNVEKNCGFMNCDECWNGEVKE